MTYRIKIAIGSVLDKALQINAKLVIREKIRVRVRGMIKGKFRVSVKVRDLVKRALASADSSYG